MIFPIEIWSKIFSYLDPITLTRLKIVCKAWKEEIDKMLQESNQWLIHCEEHIPQENWATLLEKLYPTKAWMNFERSEADTRIWMKMYKLWTKYNRLIKLNLDFSKRSFSPLPRHHLREEITSIAVLDKILGIGSTEGYIYLYDIHDLSKPFDILDHKECVTIIKLFREGKNTIVVSCSLNHHVKIWNLHNKKLIQKKFGRLLCTSYDQCFILTANELNILASDKKLKGYQFDLYDLVGLAAMKNQVLLYSDRGYYLHLNVEEGKSHSGFIEPPKVKVRKYYVFMPELLACIAEGGLLGFSVNGSNWKIHNIFPIFQAIPTTILVFFQLLIIGFDCGDVYVCHIEDFETVDFELIETKRIFSDIIPITSLDIGVSSKGEFLAIASETKVHILKF